ncbi:guanine nucleotide binding protein, partial [Reticulomyxa filosa]
YADKKEDEEFQSMLSASEKILAARKGELVIIGWTRDKYLVRLRDRSGSRKGKAEELVKALIKIWSWKAVQQLWSENYKKLPDACKYLDYYMNSIDRISQTNYHPTDEDILKSPKGGYSTNPQLFDFVIINNSYQWVDLNTHTRSIGFKTLSSWYARHDNPAALLFTVSLASFCEELGAREFEWLKKAQEKQMATKQIINKDNNISDPVIYSNVMQQSINLFGQMLDAWSAKKPKCIVLLREKQLLYDRIVNQRIPFHRYFGKNCKWGTHPSQCEPFGYHLKHQPTSPVAEEIKSESLVDIAIEGAKDPLQLLNETQYVNEIVRFIKLQFSKERKWRDYPKLLLLVENDCTDPKELKQICVEIDRALNS